MKAAQMLLFSALLAGPALAEGVPAGDLGEAGLPGAADADAAGVDTISDPELDAGLTGIDTVPGPVEGRIGPDEPFDGTIYPGDAIPGQADDGDPAESDQPIVVEADGPVVIVPEREDDDEPTTDDDGAATLDEGVDGAVAPKFIKVD